MDLQEEVALYKAQEDLLEAEREKQPLISGKQSSESLVAEFREASQVFKDKVQHIRNKYPFLRYVRRDGNCFIRASLLGLLLRIRNNATQRQHILDKFKQCLQYCLAVGYEEFVLEDFSEITLEEANFAASASSDEEIVQRLANKETSNYCVMLLRFVIGAYMIQHEDLYMAFLPQAQSMREYVRGEIEPLGRESEEGSIMALASYFELGIRVEIIDQSETPNRVPNTHVYPEGTPEPAFTLLFRPGHYDLLEDK